MSSLNELWAEEFRSLRAYAVRVTQGILAQQENPLFPSADTIEEVSADGIFRAYAASSGKQIGDRRVLFAYVRNGCRNAIKGYRRSLRKPEMVEISSGDSVEFSETVQAILSALPEAYQQ